MATCLSKRLGVRHVAAYLFILCILMTSSAGVLYAFIFSTEGYSRLSALTFSGGVIKTNTHDDGENFDQSPTSGSVVRSNESGTAPSLRFEMARYNVEKVFVQYLKHVRGELEYLKTIVETNDKSTKATQELLEFTNEWSSRTLRTDILEGRMRQKFSTLWRNISERLLLIKRHTKTKLPILERLITDTDMLKRIVQEDLDMLSKTTSKKSDAWKEQSSKRLGSVVQKKIHKLQNPTDCSKAKLLYCKFDTNCGVGFGCQVHHVAYCLFMAFSLNRTLIFNTKGWPYPVKWDHWFKPLSPCSVGAGTLKPWGDSSDDVEQTHARILHLPRIQKLLPRSKLAPLAIPEEIADDILHFNRFPPGWWVGQFMNYTMRPSKFLEDLMVKRIKEVGFKHPIVGVHVRRTDKIHTEARAYELEQYMQYVHKWYDDLEMTSPNITRRIYLATEEPKVMKEALSKYSGYTVVRNGEPSVSMNRASHTGMENIITDLLLLSKTDYAVCTHTSNVCRAVYELMQPSRGDGAVLVKSLDDIYMYNLWGLDNHTVEVIAPHTALTYREINLEVGDQVHMLIDQWNGTSIGVHRKTNKRIRFPTYKVRDYFRRVRLPIKIHDGA